MSVTGALIIFSTILSLCVGNLNHLQRLAEDPNTQDKCAEEINALDLISRVKLTDASTKIPSGVLEGNLFDLGSFDECYNLKAMRNDSSGYIYGKYCLNTLSFTGSTPESEKFKIPRSINPGIDTRMLGKNPNSIGFHWAVCLPSGCGAEDFATSLTQIDENFCYSRDENPELDTGAWITIGILLVVADLVVFSTIYEIYLHYTGTKAKSELFIAFSVLSNGRKIFKSSNSKEQLLCLNGIKAISMMWVVLGHIYGSLVAAPVANLAAILQFTEDPVNMFMVNATLSVDTFLFVGGLVTVYTYLRTVVDKKTRFNVGMYYVHRFLRLTPALGITILIYAFLGRFLGDGPLWGNVDKILGVFCRKYWWRSLLYIQNYFPSDDTCVPQTWYLAVDMQLFLLSPLILVPMVMVPIYTLIALGCLFVVGMIVPFAMGYAYELSPFLVDFRADSVAFSEKYYVQTYARFAPYVCGMFVGYFIHRVKSGTWKFALKPFQVLFAWTLGLAILVTCVYAPYELLQADYDRWTFSTFFGYHRQLWSIGLAIVTFLCVSGHGGPVDRFLSLPVFQILTKLSYSMYLIHVLLITVRFSQTRALTYFGNLELMRAFWGDFAFSAAAGLVLCLSFESPIIVLEKLIFKSR